MKYEENISKNSIIKSEINLSLHKTRELVTSWMNKSENKLDFKEEKEDINSEDEELFRSRIQKRQVYDTELSEEKALLRKKLSLFKSKKQKDEEEKVEIYDDSDEFESKSKYIEKISLIKQSKDFSYGDNDKKRANSFFDIYKSKKKKKHKSNQKFK
ncbi:hypothetical protein PNEG_01993 [Pneumocystis murina B123]|uniref:Uncharacterized protein n=1 Tax=Pneumocystis murina (strain B123) TaxID=1069680 RepID=M7NRC9_PNEMU|nr:hypothetical protein PNEG_01993 [Pneumocystis murina B123]EMR09812.1 hypothetical protein PNEG_01993 [Pneumocystis murina B123]